VPSTAVVLRRDSNQNDGNISQYNRIRGPLVWARANKNVMFAVERGYDAEAQVMGNPDAVCLCAPDFPVDRSAALGRPCGRLISHTPIEFRLPTGGAFEVGLAALGVRKLRVFIYKTSCGCSSIR
jgi:hypothetical protein